MLGTLPTQIMDHPQACENTAKRPKMYGVNWSAHIELRRPINPFETGILKHVFPQLEGCDLEADLINNHHQLCLELVAAIFKSSTLELGHLQSIGRLRTKTDDYFLVNSQKIHRSSYKLWMSLHLSPTPLRLRDPKTARDEILFAEAFSPQTNPWLSTLGADHLTSWHRNPPPRNRNLETSPPEKHGF